MSSRRRIGVFGSLFNPPHLGHLLLCSEAAWQLDLERVVLVPTARPAHRPAPAESEGVRYSMSVAFAATDPILSVSRVELDRPGPSYMVDTLRELARRYPLCEIVLLLGGDQLATLGTWHEAESLPRLARIAVAPRPGIEIPGLAKARVDIIEMPLLGLSSTMIRRRVAAGQPIRHLVAHGVCAVIERERLYRDATEGAHPAKPTVLAWPDEPWKNAPTS